MVQIHLPLPYLFPFGGTNGPLVKWLRHRPFTAATRVRISYGSPGAKKSRYALRTGSFSTHLPVEDVNRNITAGDAAMSQTKPGASPQTRASGSLRLGRTRLRAVARRRSAGDAAVSRRKPEARLALRQERVRRGNVTNEPQSASSRPGRGRVIPPREGCPPPPCRPAGGWPGGRWRRSPRRG